uniref:Programmed cell death protein 4-like n=1 Tax=Cicer arietinum TaxID=3827 RepID=A0A1S2Z0Z8_CICAR|nr:programmed cell death protein 4-like [Cicer arietinum]
MKDTGKSHKANGKSSPETRKDRKSATGTSGSPKKGGHGGKFTWIGRGYEDLQIGPDYGALDSKDPNFEDREEIAAV